MKEKLIIYFYLYQKKSGYLIQFNLIQLNNLNIE